jgi:prepilin-type processing-associated H-X9-DG protein
MISVNIAFDNNDIGLGDFFRQCKEDLIRFLDDQKIDNGNNTEYDVHEMHSGRCNVVYVDVRLPLINGNNFLFIAYSHGDVDCLTAGGSYYIDSNSNSQLFKNSFFYAVACRTGADLGPALVGKGSHAFIGYSEDYYVPNGHVPLFINCVNVGVKMFLIGQTAKESFRLMVQHYDQKIDELKELNDIIPASWLVKNREALVFLGKEDLTIANFNV